MSFFDKIKSLFSGGPSDRADEHAGHDDSGHAHAGHEHSHEPAAPAIPPIDPAGMPTAEPTRPEEGENRPQ